MINNILNFIFLPIRFLLSNDFIESIGLKSVRQERYDLVKRFSKGYLLDVGAGNNSLVKQYKEETKNDAIGVDIYDWGGGFNNNCRK